MRSIKTGVLDRMIWFGEQPLRRAIFEYLENDHRERNHQGLENGLIEAQPARCDGEVMCRGRLGGLLKHYERAA